ncbi:hypothetical protein [Streptomyces sp. NPDC052693]|uniref:DUF6907 domain-containing protein n=1 Tax=Streptomyces sp. NPDC052693 TaxID=3155814 RepID=UPI00342FD8D4
MNERDEERAAEEFVARHFPETARFLAEERLRELPTFGPFEIQGGVDEPEPAVAVLRVAFALTRTQLVTALSMSFAGLGADRTPESLTDDEVRREVEGYMAAEAIIELDHQMEANERNGFTPEQQRATDVLAAAVDRAFAPPEPLPVQEPRRGEGMVTLQTVDRGEVTVPEPAWCVGHEGDPVSHFTDITHTGRTVALRFDGNRLMAARLSWAPFAQQQPEPHPLVRVDDLPLGLDPQETRELAARAGLYAGELYRLANEADRLRGYRR